MITVSRTNTDDKEKKAFVEDIRAKLTEKQDRLVCIKRKVKIATESHKLQPGDQLLRAEMHADSSVEVLRTRLELLEKADSESWPGRRVQVDVAWDELSQAIKKVVARLP